VVEDCHERLGTSSTARLLQKRRNAEIIAVRGYSNRLCEQIFKFEAKANKFYERAQERFLHQTKYCAA
jgi:hypothetical protein